MSIALRNPDDISALVKDQRLARGLTQTELAALAGVSLRWLAGLEAGSPGASIDKVTRLLDALDITLTAVLPAIATSDQATSSDADQLDGSRLDAILERHTVDHDSHGATSTTPERAGP